MLSLRQEPPFHTTHNLFPSIFVVNLRAITVANVHISPFSVQYIIIIKEYKTLWHSHYGTTYLFGFAGSMRTYLTVKCFSLAFFFCFCFAFCFQCQNGFNIQSPMLNPIQIATFNHLTPPGDYLYTAATCSTTMTINSHKISTNVKTTPEPIRWWSQKKKIN